MVIGDIDPVKAAQEYLTEIDNRITNGDKVSYYNLGLNVQQDTLIIGSTNYKMYILCLCNSYACLCTTTYSLTTIFKLIPI